MYKHHHEVNTELAKVALGREKADTVIQKGMLVNVQTGEIIKDTDIAISHGRIAYVGDATHTIGEDTKVIDATEKYIAPGLMDAHMHVESTMLTVTEFAKVAMAKGTTSIFMDPHEIANVFGAEGVRLMHEEGQQLPLKVFTTFPSCVPATDNLEDAGASLDVEDIKEGLTWNRVVGLGEVMNFPGVVNGDPKMVGEIKETMKAGKTVTGHFPDGSGDELQAYISSGVTSCHETVTREEGLEKLRLGMHLMIREGSAWHDVEEVIKVVTEDKVRTNNIMLVTDDVYPQTLVEQGHLNHVVRRAIEEGVDPVTAIQMATINVARYYKKADDLGSIAPGKCADMMILEDLYKMEPSMVLADGEVVAEDQQITKTFPSYDYPAHVKQSVNVGKELVAADFMLRAKTDQPVTDVNAIKIIENSARTEKIEAKLPVVDGMIKPDLKQDLIQIACIDRHRGSGQISLGFTQGFQINKGAVASTVAHDSHNLLVMGENPEDMALAANLLAESGGGMIVVEDSKVLAHVRMPIAGLLSDQPLDTVVDEVTVLEQAWEQIGSTLHAPFMTFSLIALPVIPEVRITNRGIADVNAFQLLETEIVK